MKVPLHRRSWVAPALLVLCSPVPAWAQDDAPLRLKAGTSLRRDSNLFRLPAGADTVALVGKSSATEQIGVSSLSLAFSRTLSLQRFELSLGLVDSRYQNFNYLSFVARNYNTAWRWSLTPRLRGNLATEHKEFLASFSDFQDITQRNQRSETNTRLDALYEVDGTWRILTGVSEFTQTSQRSLAAQGDYTSRSADLGLSYAFASGSSLTHTLKQTTGKYLGNVRPSQDLVDDGFSQSGHELRLQWAINGNSTADISAAHISRTHPNYSQRDYSGLNTGINVNWRISGKSSLSMGWVRELSSYQSSSASYTRTDRISVGPVWQISPKTAVRMGYAFAVRDYLGSPTGLSTVRRSDTTRDATLSFDWQPSQYFTLSSSLQNASRASSLPGLDYNSSMAVFSAQFNY